MRIGIWGRARVGKTTYLAMLYQYILSQSQAWSIEAADEPSREFVLVQRERIYQHKSFPERTDKVREYSYHLWQHDKGSAQLTFFDAPGELYQDYYDPQKRHKRSWLNLKPMHHNSEAHKAETEITPQEAFDHLRACDGVMIFIEPQDEQLNGQLTTHSYLYHLLEAMRTHNRQSRLSKPLLALCAVKVDARDDLWRHAESFETFSRGCKRYEGQPCLDCPLYQQLSAAFMQQQLPGLIESPRMTRCFMLSSIGRTDEQPNVGHDRPWEAKPIQSMPLVGLHSQPIDWLDQPITNIPVERTFLPSSINNIDDIRPRNLLSPIVWLMEQYAEQSERVSS